MDAQTVIVDPSGKPARALHDDRCPTCRKTADEAPRMASGGFGTPWTVCPCGYEWKDRVFRERA